MSTRSSISYGDKHHLYQECYEQNNVWLEIKDPACLEVEKDGSESAVKISIPISAWREIVEGWLKSEWASHPEQDGDKMDPIVFKNSMQQLQLLASSRREN